MKRIPLSQNKFAIVDDGDFEYLNQWKWSLMMRGGKFHASRKDSDRKVIYLHREILKPDSKFQVDHVNGDGLDNRRSNLRVCNKSQNMANRGKQVNNTSGYKGVTFHKFSGKWMAQCGKVYLGLFVDPIFAASFYNETAKKAYGDFAKLNSYAN